MKNKRVTKGTSFDFSEKLLSSFAHEWNRESEDLSPESLVKSDKLNPLMRIWMAFFIPCGDSIFGDWLTKLLAVSFPSEIAEKV